MDNNTLMTKQQCYLAIYQLFDSYFYKSDNDEILSFLASLCFLEDGIYYDDATPIDFNRSIIAALGTATITTFSMAQGLLIAYHFLKKYFEISNNPEADELIKKIHPLPDNTPTDPAIIQLWSKAVTRALEGKTDAYLFGKRKL